MALRMLLVVLVAGLGLELPSRAEVGKSDCAAGDGRAAGAVEAVRVSDQAFSAVVEEMVSAFAAGSGSGAEAAASTPASEWEDLYPGLAYALNREAEGLTGSTAPAPAAVEEVASTPASEWEDLYPGLAYALNREAEGLTGSTTAPSGLAEVEAEVADLPPALEPATPVSRVERLGQAIQLTGAAVHAWVTFLQQAPAVVPQRP